MVVPFLIQFAMKNSVECDGQRAITIITTICDCAIPGTTYQVQHNVLPGISFSVAADVCVVVFLKAACRIRKKLLYCRGVYSFSESSSDFMLIIDSRDCETRDLG